MIVLSIGAVVCFGVIDIQSWVIVLSARKESEISKLVPRTIMKKCLLQIEPRKLNFCHFDINFRPIGEEIKKIVRRFSKSPLLRQ